MFVRVDEYHELACLSRHGKKVLPGLPCGCGCGRGMRSAEDGSFSGIRIATVACTRTRAVAVFVGGSATRVIVAFAGTGKGLAEAYEHMQVSTSCSPKLFTGQMIAKTPEHKRPYFFPLSRFRSCLLKLRARRVDSQTQPFHTAAVLKKNIPGLSCVGQVSLLFFLLRIAGFR